MHAHKHFMRNKVLCFETTFKKSEIIFCQLAKMVTKYHATIWGYIDQWFVGRQMVRNFKHSLPLNQISNYIQGQITQIHI